MCLKNLDSLFSAMMFDVLNGEIKFTHFSVDIESIIIRELGGSLSLVQTASFKFSRSPFHLA